VDTTTTTISRPFFRDHPGEPMQEENFWTLCCGLSANLRCSSEICCMRLAGNTGCKKLPKIAIWAPSHNFVRLYLCNKGMHRQSENNLLSSNMSSTCPDNMVNFGPLTAEIGSGVWGTPGFASWQRYCTASSSGHQPNFAALNRGRHLCSTGRPSRWELAHILVGVFNALATNTS